MDKSSIGYVIISILAVSALITFFVLGLGATSHITWNVKDSCLIDRSIE